MEARSLAICEDLLQLMSRMKAEIVAIAEEQRLTSAQLMALRCISRDKDLLMSQVAGILHCDASNVTGIVDRLVAQGLVERREGEHDRRRKTLQVTDKGEQMVVLFKLKLSEAMEFGRLSKSEQGALNGIVIKLASQV